MKPNGRWIALTVLGLISLSAIYFYDILSGAHLLTERDLAVFFIPPRFLWVELVKNGTFPLWNPYHLNGHPLFATLQPGVFYPLSIIYFFLPFDLAFNYTILLHFFLAGFFTFLLLRRLNASYVASLISAITFMLSGYLLSVHNLLNHLLSVAWAPLVFLLFLLGLQRIPPHPNPLPQGERIGEGGRSLSPSGERKGEGGRLKFVIFSALAACAMFLGGGVEIVYVTLVMVCLLTFFWHGQTSLSMPPSFYKRVGYLGVFMAVFLGVSAVQLLPFMELSAHSIRAGGLSYKEATIWSMHPKDLLQFFLPDLYGYKLRPEKYWEDENWLKTIYLGTIPFLLSLFFFIPFSQRTRTNEFVHATHFKYAFLLIVVGSLILAFGGHTPVYFYLYKYAPYFDKIRYPVKFLFLTTLVISVTAGLGYDRLRDGIAECAMPCRHDVGVRSAECGMMKKSHTVRRLVYGIFIFSFFTALTFGCLNFFEASISSFLKSKGLDAPNYNDLFVNIHNMKRLLCITTIFGLAVFVGFKRQATRKFLPLAVLVLLTFDLFFAGQGFYFKTLSETYHGTSSNIDFIKSDKSLFRIFATPKTMKDDTVVITSSQSKDIDIINVKLEKVSPGLNVERHIFDMWGSEVMILNRVRHLYNLVTSAPKADSTNLLNLMNVKYVISVPQIDSDELKLVKMNVPVNAVQLDELEKANTIKIYQNLNCLPRAFLVRDYKVVSSEEEYKNIMQSKEFDPSKLLLLDENPHNFPSKEFYQGYEKIVEKVEITRYNTNSISLQADAAEPKFLFMSESYYPGWKAYIDGKMAHIYRANYAFRALFIEPGNHKIEFIYDPWTFKAGLIISIMTIIGVIFLLIRFK